MKTTENHTGKKRMKSSWGGRLAMAFGILIGGCGGYFGAKYFDELFEQSADAPTVFFGTIVLFCAWMLFSLFFLIVLHEAGHMVFGLMTGYQFSSFRIGSLMWQRENGRIRFRRFSLAGTGGQCLMTPPDLVDGKMPYMLYNLGGPIANLAGAVVFALAAYAMRGWRVGYACCMLTALISLVYAIVNGVPLRTSTVDNDGRNALTLGRNPLALRALWIQMKINEQLTNGVTLPEMPDEWFAFPDEKDMGNSMVASIAVFACNRLMEEHRFEEAYAKMLSLIEGDNGVVPVYRSLLALDCIYCELVGECRADHLEPLMDKQLRRLMSSMKNFLSVLRTQFAWELLYKKDHAKAEQYRMKFEKAAKNKHYPGEADGERWLVNYAAELSHR